MEPIWYFLWGGVFTLIGVIIGAAIGFVRKDNDDE